MVARSTQEVRQQYMYVFSVRNLPYCVIFIELPYLRQTPRGVKNIDELRASTVGSRELKMSMRYWWLSNCMEDSSVHACDVAETSDSSKDTVIYGHAHSKRFNWRISWRYLLPRKVHPSDVQQRRIVRREVLYPCSFSIVLMHLLLNQCSHYFGGVA